MKLISTVALIGTAVLSGAAHADLTVISFGGANQQAQQAAYYAPFSAASGIKIIAGEYNGEQAKIKAMVETRNVTWDVVEVESPELARGCEEGLYEKLDYSKIGSKADFIGKAVGECGIGTFVWSTVLAYNADKLKQAPTSWADFWDVKRIPGKRGMRKGAKFTLEFALLADGVKPADVYTVLATPAGVDRAFKKLDEIKPHIQWWEAGAQPPQMLASGDMVMSSAYNGRIAAAQAEGKNLKIVWNGGVYDVDSWAIPAGSPRIKEAYEFIRFASQAKPQSQYAALIPYGPTHKGAVGMMDAKVAADLPTAPANLEGALPSNTEFWVEYGEDLEQRFNAWAAR
ncbi:MAG: ABC transporter substrate-binding protein [Proteobacteria bacterium]|nr:MAG: ABC transporter substrate-binding protein [Pseudomonadota bacterium]